MVPAGEAAGMEIGGDDATGGRRVAVLSSASSPTLGTANVDIALYRHLIAAEPTLYLHTPESFRTDSRKALRLLEGYRKLKYPSGTREMLAELRRGSVSGRLTGMTERPVLLLDLRLVLLE